jgi:hypothetical protein
MEWRPNWNNGEKLSVQQTPVYNSCWNFVLKLLEKGSTRKESAGSKSCRKNAHIFPTGPTKPSQKRWSRGVMSLTFWVISIGDKENVSGLIQYFNLQ